MNKKMSKRQRDIKTKLMAAICMLLVSSIMMVSTTYAWFTLSTAPEVTGIQTAVGANGNLEMALMPTDGLRTTEADFGITSGVSDSMDIASKDIKEANITWGNLVKLDEGYGLDQITLYPAQLNLITTDTININTGFLEAPKYGADGRVSELQVVNSTGIFSGTSFLPDSDQATTNYGVRAIGNASGLSERELSLRNAKGNMLGIATAVQTAATNSLSSNGKSLANIVIKYADVGASATFKNDELKPIGTMIDDLEAMMDQIDTAYKNAVMALIASGLTDTSGNLLMTDVQVATAQTAFNQAANYDAFITALYGTDGDDADTDPDNKAAIDAMLEAAGLVKSDGSGLVDKYKATKQAVEDAATGYDTAIASTADKTWTDVVNILTNIANPDQMLVNGKPKDQIDKDQLVSDVAGGTGITITIQPGGGAFADIADHCDNYTAKVPIGGITVKGVTLPDTMTANMKTASNVFYLSSIATGLKAAPGAAAGTMPITDFYGYIIDLAFRTNAAESKLLLQVDAADRIYDDNSNEDTAGHGSNMTFSSTSPDFGNDSIKNLMKSIKVVFFDPTSGKIVANAYLDADNAEITVEGVKADLHIANATTTPHFAVTTSTTTGEGADAVTTTTTTYYYGTQSTDENNVVTSIYTDASGNNLFKTVYTPEVKDGEGNVTTQASTDYYAWVPESTTGEGDAAVTTPAAWATTANTDATQIDNWNKSKVVWTPNNSGEEIMDLSQNTAKALSVLVYLDGTTVTNKDVAYSSTTSMTGTLNLQFASSANLTAMEYADLHTPGATEAPTEAQTQG